VTSLRRIKRETRRHRYISDINVVCLIRVSPGPRARAGADEASSAQRSEPRQLNKHSASFGASRDDDVRERESGTPACRISARVRMQRMQRIRAPGMRVEESSRAHFPALGLGTQPTRHGNARSAFSLSTSPRNSVSVRTEVSAEARSVPGVRDFAICAMTGGSAHRG